MSNCPCGGGRQRRQRVGDELRRAVVQARELGVEARRKAVEDLLHIGVGRTRWCRFDAGRRPAGAAPPGCRGPRPAIRGTAARPASSSPSSTSARITWSRAWTWRGHSAMARLLATRPSRTWPRRISTCDRLYQASPKSGSMAMAWRHAASACSSSPRLRCSVPRLFWVPALLGSSVGAAAIGLRRLVEAAELQQHVAEVVPGRRPPRAWRRSPGGSARPPLRRRPARGAARPGSAARRAGQASASGSASAARCGVVELLVAQQLDGVLSSSRWPGSCSALGLGAGGDGEVECVDLRIRVSSVTAAAAAAGGGVVTRPVGAGTGIAARGVVPVSITGLWTPTPSGPGICAAPMPSLLSRSHSRNRCPSRPAAPISVARRLSAASGTRSRCAAARCWSGSHRSRGRPISTSVQRDTTSLTTSSPYSNGMPWLACTRLRMRPSCSRTMLRHASRRTAGSTGSSPADRAARPGRPSAAARAAPSRCPPASGISSGSLHRFMISSLPTLLVSRMMVFLKSMTRPSPSSIQPLSKTWKNSSCTSGCAFSTSSSSTTL